MQKAFLILPQFTFLASPSSPQGSSSYPELSTCPQELNLTTLHPYTVSSSLLCKECLLTCLCLVNSYRSLNTQMGNAAVQWIAFCSRSQVLKSAHHSKLHMLKITLIFWPYIYNYLFYTMRRRCSRQFRVLTHLILRTVADCIPKHFCSNISLPTCSFYNNSDTPSSWRARVYVSPT